MHITKYLLGFFLLVQGIYLCPGPKNLDSKTVERKERLKNKVYKLQSSASDNGVIYYSNLQAPTWVRVKLSKASENILDAAAKLVKDAEALLSGDPAAKNLTEVLLCYPGLFAIAAYRVAHFFYQFLGVRQRWQPLRNPIDNAFSSPIPLFRFF